VNGEADDILKNDFDGFENGEYCKYTLKNGNFNRENDVNHRILGRTHVFAQPRRGLDAQRSNSF